MPSGKGWTAGLMKGMWPKRTLAALAVILAVLAAWADGPAAGEADGPLARAEAYLRENAGQLALRPDLRDLRLADLRQGRSAQHVSYQQVVDGVPVFGQYLTVSLPLAGEGRSTDPVLLKRPVTRTRPPASPFLLSSGQALAIVGEAVSLAPANLRGAVSTELVYYPLDPSSGELAPAWQIVAPTVEPLGSWLFLVQADSGQTLLHENLLRLDSGRLFDPNPAKSSGGAVPPPNNCDSASAESTLSSQYQTRTLLGIGSGQGKLAGQFVDLTAPGILGAYKPAGQADEPAHNYVYGCNDDRFEEVMVYHNVDAVQRKIQALGFSGASGILNYPVPAHAHYFSDCNAFFDPTDLGLHFGDSSVCSPSADSAEDADVIVHEYGHAIQQDQVPGWGFGSLSQAREALAMGEGFGDFLPAAVFGDPCLAEWSNFGVAACGGGPGLRNLENSATYSGGNVVSLPSWCSSGSDPHCAGLVWSGALWDLAQALGDDQAARDTVLTLVLDGQFYLDPQSTFAEAAAAIRQSDTLLYGGTHVGSIDAVFSGRGISATGAVADFPYAYLRILHPYRGNLDVQIKVGANPSSPLCTINVWNGNPSQSGDDLIGFLTLNSGTCATHLPPTPSTPWLLEAVDTAAQNTGSIEQFEIVLSGTARCIATDVAVPIPDNGGFVHSAVDCTTMVSAPGDSDGDTLPDPVDSDDDDDGFADSVEIFVGTDPLKACAATTSPGDEDPDPWPPDFTDDRVVNVTDIVFVLPPYFGSTSADPDYLARSDLMADGVINIFDLSAMLPPLFGRSCQ